MGVSLLIRAASISMLPTRLPHSKLIAQQSEWRWSLDSVIVICNLWDNLQRLGVEFWKPIDFRRNLLYFTNGYLAEAQAPLAMFGRIRDLGNLQY